MKFRLTYQIIIVFLASFHGVGAAAEPASHAENARAYEIFEVVCLTAGADKPDLTERFRAAGFARDDAGGWLDESGTMTADGGGTPADGQTGCAIMLNDGDHEYIGRRVEDRLAEIWSGEEFVPATKEDGSDQFMWMKETSDKTAIVQVSMTKERMVLMVLQELHWNTSQ